MKRTGRATIEDVAAMAGVSRATVSRVLTGAATVSPDKVRAVQEAIEATHFLASTPARQLATGRSESIGVVLTEPVDLLFADPTFVTLFKGILDGLAPEPSTPSLYMASTPSERSKSLRRFRSGAVDAIIHLSPYTDDEFLDDLRDLRIPVVLCGPSGRTATSAEGMSVVYADDAAGAALAAAHLIGRGVRQVRAIMGPAENPATAGRLGGYRAALGDRLGARVTYGPWDESTGWQGVDDLCRNDPDFDALVCGNDRIARGAIRALHRHGRSVPGDVLVVGFDDHATSAADVVGLADDVAFPALTTVHEPFHEEGLLAARCACEMAQGKPARLELLEMQLVIRESA